MTPVHWTLIAASVSSAETAAGTAAGAVGAAGGSGIQASLADEQHSLMELINQTHKIQCAFAI